MNLCLNGHIVDINGEKNSIIVVDKAYTLNIYDCTAVSHYFTVTEDYGLWKLDDTKTDGAIFIGDINADTELTTGTVIWVYGGVITGSKEDGGGGALYLDDKGCKVNLYGGNIIGNSAEDGGGVYIDAGTFTMSGRWTYIAGNEARKDHGGGVFVDDDSKFVMNDGGIIGNSATSDSGDGGGVYMDDNAEFTMNGGLIAGNLADVSGGGVYLDVSGDGEFVMKGYAEISNNTAYYGGGVGEGDGKFKMYDYSKITDNSAAKSGGGIDMRPYKYESDLSYGNADCVGVFYMYDHATISGNSAPEGGGIYLTGYYATGRLYNSCQVIGNYAIYDLDGDEGGKGGGVFAGAGCVFEIKDNAQITDNTADQYGGGVYVRGASITGYDKYAGNGELFMNGGKINKNLAWEDGGGVYVGEPGSNNLNGLFTMSAGSIEENTALAHGGGVYVAGGDEAFEMSGGTITKNKANSCSGYGIFIDEGTFTMTGSAVITENYTTNFAGAGVHVGGGNITIKNLTGTASAVAGIYGNKKTSDGNDVWNVDLSSYDRFTLDGILSGNTVIGITDHGRNSKPGDIFGTAADGAGGAEHIKSDTLKDRQGNPLGAIIVGTSLMWDDTETGEVPFVPVESIPDEEPTEKPTEKPTAEPTPEPTEKPGEKPYDPERTGKPPEHTPTAEPTPEPTKEPAEKPTEKPTAEPTPEPTPEPTEKPGEKPDEPGKTGKPPEYTPPAEPAEESDELLNNPSGV